MMTKKLSFNHFEAVPFDTLLSIKGGEGDTLSMYDESGGSAGCVPGSGLPIGVGQVGNDVTQGFNNLLGGFSDFLEGAEKAANLALKAGQKLLEQGYKKIAPVSVPPIIIDPRYMDPNMMPPSTPVIVSNDSSRCT